MTDVEVSKFSEQDQKGLDDIVQALMKKNEVELTSSVENEKMVTEPQKKAEESKISDADKAALDAVKAKIADLSNTANIRDSSSGRAANNAMAVEVEQELARLKASGIDVSSQISQFQTAIAIKKLLFAIIKTFSAKKVNL